MTTAERVADLTRELPEDAQAEVLDFVEFLRAKALSRRPSGTSTDGRGSIEQLHEARRAWRALPPDANEPEWSPDEIERMDLGEGDDA